MDYEVTVTRRERNPKWVPNSLSNFGRDDRTEEQRDEYRNVSVLIVTLNDGEFAALKKSVLETFK